MLKRDDFIFSIAQLRQYLSQKEWDLEKVQLPNKEIPVSFSLLIPKYYADLIDWYDPGDPLRKMVVPISQENNIKKYELEDPIGDKVHTKVPGLIHRYPDRVLLNLTNTCPIHCRFCFRRNLLSKSKLDFSKSLEYIRTHKKIWEVILSGGDPFMLTDDFLAKVIDKLKHISHIRLIRFHTRTPVVYPARITRSLIEVISKANPAIIVFHLNHPKEITSTFKKTVEELKKTGAILLSQTVLLKGVNSNPQVLAKLFKGLISLGIKPYYLHHLDLTKGTDHFRVSVSQGKKIFQKLRGNISGVCLPEYVIDVPGGYGKIPVFWFKKVGLRKYRAFNFAGRLVQYVDLL